MRKQFLCSTVCVVAVVAATPVLAAPWTRSFVVDFYEPAFFYGGPPLTTEAPGSDCPKGTVPAHHAATLSAEGVRLRIPAAQRTFAPGIDVYLNPHTAPDPGQQEVTGKIAIGFNLDGDAKTGGFVGTNGEQGIDNQLYRVLGCYMSYRGIPYHAHLSTRANDKMLEGLYTIVVRVSGNGDPMNDDNAVVDIGYSPEHVVKDANGKVAQDYSYRLATTAQYTRLKAKVKDGIVETEQVPALKMPQFAWYETNRGEVNFQRGKLQLTMNKDGTMSGLVGGYLDWRHFYSQDAFNIPSGGANRESYYHQNEVGIYYGLKRNADFAPDPKTGQNTAISAAYRFTAQPAFVVDPARPLTIDQPTFRDNSVRDDRALFIEAATTAKVVYRPPGRARGGPPAAAAPAPAPAPATPVASAADAAPTQTASNPVTAVTR